MAPRGPGDLDAHKGGGIDGDGPRSHLGDGDEIGELRHVQPVVDIHHLGLDEGEGRIPPAKAEKPDLEKAEKELDQDQDEPSFRRWKAKVAVMPRSAQARRIQATLSPSQSRVTRKAPTMMAVGSHSRRRRISPPMSITTLAMTADTPACIPLRTAATTRFSRKAV